MCGHITTKTPLGPETGKGAVVIKQPHARDDIGTKLETTGKEVLSKIVIVNNSSIQDSWTHKGSLPKKTKKTLDLRVASCELR